MYSMHDQMNMATLRTGVYDDNSDSSLTQWILDLGTSKPCGIGAYRFNNFENGHRRARSKPVAMFGDTYVGLSPC